MRLLARTEAPDLEVGPGPVDAAPPFLHPAIGEVTPMPVGSVAIVQAPGFEPDALLRDHLCPGGDESYDLMLMADHIVDTRTELATGVAEGLG